MPPKKGKAPAAASPTSDSDSAAAIAMPTVDKILLLMPGPMWLEVDRQPDGRCSVHLNQTLGAGVTLQTCTNDTVAAAVGSGKSGAVATAASPEKIAALLPNADGRLVVVPDGAYACVRMEGTLRN
jgi:hypothetical protein